jgi:conflict system STAND superfamily ATPase/trypsin-like peptidase
MSVDVEVAERGSAGLSATACVRIRDQLDEVVGSGFLVGPDLVATCAHVVADAARSDPSAPAAPDRRLVVDFPMSADGAVVRSASVHRWVPIAEDGTGDVALLRLDAPAPPGAVMPPLRRIEGLWGHRFRAFGFPEGRMDGVWTTGLIRAAQGTGWFQLQGVPGDQPVEGGFSGAPVWDDETWAAVGMMVAADRGPDVTTAYLIPVEQVLGLDPELLPCPYRGLEPFAEEHADDFFGREPDIRRLRDTVQRCSLTTVVGPSGAGKSSLIHAGLLPELRADGAHIAHVRPHPDRSLRLDVTTAVLTLADPGSGQPRRARDAVRIAAALADPPTRDAALTELTAALAEAQAPRLVLVVDQFEELAETSPETAREVLAMLAALVDGEPARAVRVVLTARGPALDEVLTPAVAEALGPGMVLVGPLDRARLREAIIRPAERAPGLSFEDGLVDRILDDAGAEPGQLPLVESLLAELWERREGGMLTVAGYRAAGGVAGALAAHAERVVTAVFPTEADRERLRGLGMRLAVPASGGQFVRRPVRYTELGRELRALVPPLAAGRLVVVSGGLGSASTVELAHQSLIEHWPRLRDWLAADREFLAWRADLDIDRRRWENAGRDDGALPRGATLTDAEGWLSSRSDQLSDDEVDFVRRGQTRRRRERRRRRTVLAALAVLLLVAGALTVVAVRGRGDIGTLRSTANAESLGRAAGGYAQRNPVLAAELALAAWRSDPSNPVARGALADQYLALGSTERVVTGAPGGTPILSIDAAGTGARGAVLLGTDDPTVDFVLAPAGPTPRRMALPDPAGVTSGVISPDGQWYLYLSGDGAVRLWGVGGDSAPRELAAPSGAHRTLAGFSPDGSRLAWVRPGAPGGLVLTVFDLTSHTGRDIVTSIQADVSALRLTSDPDQVLIRRGAKTEPGSRLVSRSLAGNADVRVLPPDTQVTEGGATAVTCAPKDPNVLWSRTFLTVADVATGAVVRQLALAPDLACGDYRLSADHRYALQVLSNGKARWVWRATELSTGRSYQFATPPMDTSAWPKGEAPWITLLPETTGAPAVLVAAGPVLLRGHTQPEVPADTGSRPPRRFAMAAGHEIVTTDASSDLAGYDPVSGRRVAFRTDLPAHGLVFGDDDLWGLAPTPTGWRLTRYPTPTLNPAFQVTLPSDPGGAPPAEGVNVVMGRDPGGPAQRAIYLIGGVLGAFDATTGQPLGQPVALAHNAVERDWYRTRAYLWPRLGHPDQALVGVPGGHVQLWDVPRGRMLADLPIAVTGATSIAAQGDRLVALVQRGDLEEWDLATRRRVRANMQLSMVEKLYGFDTDGYLVAGYLSPPDWAVIVFYDLDRQAEAGALRTAAAGQARATPTSIKISGEVGSLPTEFAGTARQWHDQLCRLLPGQLSHAAQAVLPAGAPATPCAAG